MILLTFLIRRTAQALEQQVALAQNAVLANPGTLAALGLTESPERFITTPTNSEISLAITLTESATFRTLFGTPAARAQVMKDFGRGSIAQTMFQDGIVETVDISPP